MKEELHKSKGEQQQRCHTRSTCSHKHWQDRGPRAPGAIRQPESQSTTHQGKALQPL